MTKYWKGIISALGMLLIVLNALAGQSVGIPPNVQGWITLLIAVLTPTLVVLKKNEPA